MQAVNYESNLLLALQNLTETIEFVKSNSNNLEAHVMEKIIHKNTLKIGMSLMKGYFDNITNNDIGKKFVNNEGKIYNRKKIISKDYFSIFGKFTIDRRSYDSNGLKTICPLDIQCNLPKKVYSYYLQDAMNTISVQNTFSETKNILGKILHIDIYERPLEDLTLFSSNYYDEYYLNKNITNLANEGEIQVMSFDGKGIPMIKKEAAKIKGRQGKGEKKQKKKEALVGVSYTVDKYIRTATQIADNLIFPDNKVINKDNLKIPKGQNIRRMASLIKPKDEIVKEIERDAALRNHTFNRENVVLIDGMPSLQKLVEKNFSKIKDYTIILDIIHALEYLYIAAHVFYKESSLEAKRYVHKQLISILKGKVGRVIGGIKQSATKKSIKGSKLKSLQKVTKYLSNHKKLMQYHKYIALGFPIGTGVVESTCKTLVKDRMEGSGKRWSLNGAEAMLKLRSIKTSGDMENYHRFYIEKEFEKRTQVYNFSLKIAN